MQREADARFHDAVEATRLGTLFAHNANAYTNWARRRPARTPSAKKPSDAVILGQIAQLGAMFPGSVVHGVMPA